MVEETEEYFNEIVDILKARKSALMKEIDYTFADLSMRPLKAHIKLFINFFLEDHSKSQEAKIRDFISASTETLYNVVSLFRSSKQTARALLQV